MICAYEPNSKRSPAQRRAEQVADGSVSFSPVAPRLRTPVVYVFVYVFVCVIHQHTRKYLCVCVCVCVLRWNLCICPCYI
jgi:hypothetical protein